MGQALVFTVAKVAGGYLGLVGSASGLRRVSHLHPHPEVAVVEIEAHFPGLTRDDYAFGDLPQRLASYFGGEPGSFSDTPLDWEGSTPFHRQVYAAARRIPWGQVASYGELAAQVGRPRAARAVGQAMARNPWPLVVP